MNIRKQVPKVLVELSFTPNTLTSLAVADSNDVLLAAGGQEAEIHLSMHAPGSSRHRHNVLWQHDFQMAGSINNSVLLTSLSLTRSHESSVEPRIGISNNDCTVKFYDVPMRLQNTKRTLREVGSLRLDVPVNHCSYRCSNSGIDTLLTCTLDRQLRYRQTAAHCFRLATRTESICIISLAAHG